MEHTLLLVFGLVGGVGRVRTNHLLHLVRDAHALDDLNVLHARKDLVLNSETGLHAESSSFLDGERLRLQRFESTGRRQIDDDVGTALNLVTRKVSLVGGLKAPKCYPTSSPRETMMTLRGSLASPMVVPEPMPKLSFHFLKLSSFWSVRFEN